MFFVCFGIQGKRRKIFDNRLRQKHVNQLISLGQSGERSIQSRMLDPKSCWKSQHQGIHPCSRVYVTYSHRYFHVPMIVLHLQYSWLYGNISKFVGSSSNDAMFRTRDQPSVILIGRSWAMDVWRCWHSQEWSITIWCLELQLLVVFYRSWNTIMGTNIWSCTSKGQTKMWTYHEVEVSPKISPKIFRWWRVHCSHSSQKAGKVHKAPGILIALLELSIVVAWVFKTYDSEMMDPEGKKQVKIAGLSGKS